MKFKIDVHPKEMLFNTCKNFNVKSKDTFMFHMEMQYGSKLKRMTKKQLISFIHEKDGGFYDLYFNMYRNEKELESIKYFLEENIRIIRELEEELNELKNK